MTAEHLTMAPGQQSSEASYEEQFLYSLPLRSVEEFVQELS